MLVVLELVSSDGRLPWIRLLACMAFGGLVYPWVRACFTSEGVFGRCSEARFSYDIRAFSVSCSYFQIMRALSAFFPHRTSLRNKLICVCDNCWSSACVVASSNAVTLDNMSQSNKAHLSRASQQPRLRAGILASSADHVLNRSANETSLLHVGERTLLWCLPIQCLLQSRPQSMSCPGCQHVQPSAQGLSPVQEAQYACIQGAMTADFMSKTESANGQYCAAVRVGKVWVWDGTDQGMP